MLWISHYQSMFVTRKMVGENILETNKILYKWPWVDDLSLYMMSFFIKISKKYPNRNTLNVAICVSLFEAISKEDEKLFGKHFGSHVGGDYLINIWHGYDWSLTGTSQQRCTINISGTSNVLNAYSKYYWFK